MRFDKIFAKASGVQMSVFGEPIVYLPLDGTPRPIRLAIVHRQPPAPLGSAPDQHVPMFVVQVPCDSTGISATEIDPGSDQIMVSVLKGGEPEARTIDKLNSVRHGITEFEVR